MKRLYATLSKKDSIDGLIRALEDYKKSIADKTRMFIDELMNAGIDVAVANEGEYAGMIQFRKEISNTEDGCAGMIIATDGQKMIREWYSNGTIISRTVSPLLMAEFGSGWLANVLSDIDGVGQGTFPGQIHAFDEGGWSWTTPDGVKHHSIGETPTYPMHKAFLEMMDEANRIGKRVYG